MSNIVSNNIYSNEQKNSETIMGNVKSKLV